MVIRHYPSLGATVIFTWDQGTIGLRLSSLERSATLKTGADNESASYSLATLIGMSSTLR